VRPFRVGVFLVNHVEFREAMMFKPEGVYVAMMTPFREDGTVNEEELRRTVDFAIDGGVDGLFPVSTVGEYVHMTLEERFRVMEVVAEQARGRVKVTPGVGTTHPQQSIVLAEKAKALGSDGVVIPPPYFYTLSQEMIEKYFESIADAVDIPIILYNIPLFTQPLSYDVVKRLARRPNIIGMKDSSGSMVDFVHFVDKCRLIGEDMAFLVGREDIFFPALMAGARGCMVVIAGILPEIMVAIYRAWQRGDYQEAVELQYSILLLMRAMFSMPFPLGFKVAMEMRGFKMGPPKQPLSDAERFKYNTTKSRIQKIMRSILDKMDSGEIVARAG
jgi:4-hydroxy-tetrahydrodipicolinate synthase